MTPEQRNKLKGMFFGLPVGDALGTTLEFHERDSYEHITEMMGGGPFNLQIGEWTDDTSMALALGKTLIDFGFNPMNTDPFRNELLKNFTRWYRNGEFSHNNRCFDIGNTTQGAIKMFITSGGLNNYPASTHFMDSGNGGIMRLAPAVVWAVSRIADYETKDIPEAKHYDPVQFLAVVQSETTHASPECLHIASVMARALWSLTERNVTYHSLNYMIGSIPAGRNAVDSSGYVKATWEAANWAVSETDNFRDALLLAVNLGDDADTVGAVTGQIAGALYGYDAIPPEWLEVLAWKDYLDDMFDKLVGDAENG